MATEKKVTQPTNMVVMKIGWDSIVLPIKDATAIMTALTNAEAYGTEYVEGNREGFIGGDLPDFSMALMDQTAYVAAKLRGPKPKEGV